jgi:outer membrane protein TolC
MNYFKYPFGLKSFLPVIVLFIGSSLFSQGNSGELTLQQCIDYGLSHNPNILSSNLEAERDEFRMKETRAAYLPQVNAAAQVINNLQRPTQILPGELAGTPGQDIPVQFGTRYNVNASLDASQTLFDRSQLYAFQITKQNAKLTELNVQKTQEQLIYDIATAYYSAQVSLTQKDLIQNNLSKIDTLLKLTRIQFENGFATKLDVNRLEVNRTNLQTELSTSEMDYQQQLMLLKYYMGMPLDNGISLPAISPGTAAANTSLISSEDINRTDIQLTQAQRELYALNLKQIRAGYIPSLSANFHFAYQFQQNDLRMFNKDANWFPSSYAGLTLNIPIFDGLSKYSRSSQMKIQIRQSELDEQYLTESVKMQRTNAQNKLRINLSALESQQRNIQLASEVYETTRAQYIGGIVSMTDIVNAENALREAQTNYLSSLVQVKLAELDLIRTTGNIKTLN